MPIRSLKDGTIKIRVDDNGSGSAASVTINLEEGDLNYTERRPPSNIISDRGVLAHARRAGDEALELSFSMMYQSFTLHASPTPYEFLRKLAEAAAYLSQESDSDVWAVDIEFTIADPAGGSSTVVSFDRFIPEEVSFTEGDPYDTLSVSGRSPKPSPFSQPNDLPRLVGWWEADHLATVLGGELSDAEVVANWPDKSGQNHDFLQATADNKPTYQTNEVNGKGVVRFDGTDDRLAVTLRHTVSQGYSYFLVAKHITGSVTVDEYFVGGLNSAVGASGEIIATAEAGTDQLAMKAGTESPIGDLSGSYFVLVAAFDGATSVARYDRVQTTESAGVGNLKKIVLGANGAEDAGPCDMDVAEFAVFEKKLSTAQMRALEDYANQKYAV